MNVYKVKHIPSGLYLFENGNRWRIYELRVVGKIYLQVPNLNNTIFDPDYPEDIYQTNIYQFIEFKKEDFQIEIYELKLVGVI